MTVAPLCLHPPNRIILASASPRRRALLASLGVAFEVCPASVDESALPGESPLQTQQRITRQKAQHARCTLPFDANAAVIACDTTVLLDGVMLNKPADADEARHMLRLLRGRVHQVQSTLVVRCDGAEVLDVVVSDVRMRAYSDAEIEAYVATGDPLDKAGSYAVQHPLFQPVERIYGCPLNVIGLPLCMLRARLPFLGDPASVCVRLFGRPCPLVLGTREHEVDGRMREGL
ncbi:MAG: nucleoside triphosphate pyrophosphatase [Anaerolineae bacterium]|nr:Maf family protein [Thermoflexales bacterium]MDW8396865.1 nucleoside triphosphate pyrophosphatase [Anaerolineae bacterium]